MMSGRANGKGPPLWFVGLLLLASVFAFLVLLNSLLSSASASWVPATLSEFGDRDPADFQPVLGDGSNSLPGFESREAEGLALSSVNDLPQEEEPEEEETREAEGLALSSVNDLPQEEEPEEEETREAEGLALSSVMYSAAEEEEAPDDENASAFSVDTSGDVLGDIASDVSAIRALLEGDSVETLEAQPEQEEVKADESEADFSEASSADSSLATDTDIVTLNTIHTDIWLLLFTLWGFAGVFLAFKLGGVILGRL